VVNAYWSVILVDLPDYRVVPNPLNRFTTPPNGQRNRPTIWG